MRAFSILLIVSIICSIYRVFNKNIANNLK
nr:MAG TPA: hypothetical protein [Caudoviricetes sp.]